tara:strand:+ start:194 stop:649 length:456 start_codon:yes stop_codon:yes gene_type:complete
MNFFLAAPAISLLILEGLRWDQLELQLLSELIKIHSFFATDTTSPLIAPFLVVLGGSFGFITTTKAQSKDVLWVRILFYALSLFVLLWTLIQVSPPISVKITGSLESITPAIDLNDGKNPLANILGAALVLVSGWLVNRFRAQTQNRPPSG